MKILFVINDLLVGGSETFLIRLANYLSEKHQISIYNLNPEQTDIELSKKIKSSIKLYQSLYKNFNKFINLKFIKKLNDKFSIQYQVDKKHFNILIRKTKPDIICSFMYQSDAFVTNAFNNCKTPIILSSRGCYSLHYKDNKNKPNALLYYLNECKRIYKKIDGLIYVADKNLEILEIIKWKFNKPKLKIYNGISIKSELKHRRENEFIRFVLVARGVQEKGWLEAIIAFRKQLEFFKNTTIELYLIGESPFLDLLKKQYSNNQIKYLGFISNPGDYIKLCDVCLLPTYFDGESLPNSVIEYLAYNKPVIATKVGEIPNMLHTSEGTAGILIDLKNGKANIEQLSHAMKAYIENPDLLKIHSERAKLAFKKFDMEVCANNYIDFFNHVIENKKNG